MSANQTKAIKPETATARTLIFDIETSPNIAYVWGKYEQDALGDLIKERQIISIAWKWLGEKTVHCLSLPMLPTYKKNPEDNRGLILKLHELFSQADIVVGHNVDSFDCPMSNSEFLIHGLKPPPPHRSVDTLKFARHKFRFNSNKLGDLGKRLGIGAKVHTGGFDLWAGCLRGDEKAWARMAIYNMGDVALLEKIYMKMRPWMISHPAITTRGEVECPQCQSKNIQSRGTRIRRAGRVPTYQCQDCGTWSMGMLVKDKNAINPKAKKWIVK